MIGDQEFFNVWAEFWDNGRMPDRDIVKKILEGHMGKQKAREMIIKRKSVY